ncbi:hypothetical protein K9U39_02265 [Rhodoblastus acidophilus]|nr:hypothetical protein [Rhodoblastus acidophilus]
MMASTMPLMAEPPAVWRPVGPHVPPWAYWRHRHFHHRFRPPPPPYQPFPFGFPEPYGAPRNGPEILPPPAVPQSSPGTPAAPQRAAPLPAFSQGMTITIRKTLHENGEDGGRKPSPLIDRPRQAAERLAACWSPPLPRKGETVEATIRFSFNSRGTIIGGAPRVTYVKAGAGVTAGQVRDSILAAVKDCTPLRFSKSMAASAPGYPLSVHFIGRLADDNRGPN